MRKWYVAILAVFSLAISTVGVAGAQEPPGHLPAGSLNVDLVSKLQLTDVPGGVADVAYLKGFAYVNAFSPECVSRGGSGTGVHIVDVRDPANPVKVGFIPAHPNSYVGEGISVVEADTPFFTGDILIHNNETCDSSKFTPSGASIWDVTDPLNPKRLGRRTSITSNFGDPDPATANQMFHTTHSAQLWTQPGKIFAFLTDNQEIKDVDIFDLTDPNNPVLAAEQGLEDWPGAQGSYANGDTVFHHDSQFKRIGGNDFLLVSYWDAGQVLLNVNDPYNPVFVGDSDYRFPDPLLPSIEVPEGNSHQAYWSSDNNWILSSDEDFSPTRTLCETVTGTNAGPTSCGEFGFTVPLTDNFPTGFSGTTVYGGSGCVEDLNGNGISDRDEVPPASETGATAVVFSRGVCFFSIKIETGQIAGYDMVVVGNHHTGARGGLVPEAFLCGGQGHEYTKTASAICVGHQTMHELFNDPPEYTPPDPATPGADVVPIGTIGETISVQPGVFDGWGYVHLHDATQPDLPIVDSFAVPEALDPAFAAGFGDLTIHEVKTDPRPGVNLAYLSYYNAGFRVWGFGAAGITELGFFIDEGGNHFWGVWPIGAEYAGFGYPFPASEVPEPLILASDRDFGLYIFDYTGPLPG
jgi:hypothetical protein